MFLYDLAGAPGRSLYDRLTGCIRRDILEGRLPAGSRLPSKRCAAAAWGISVVTVMAAYDQLLAEGYLVSEQRRGYYVAQVEQWEMHPASAVPPSLGIADCPVPEQTEQPDDVIDLIQNRVPPDLFPLSVWNRLSRRVWREEGQALLRRTDYNGLPALRGAIRDSLYESRGIRAEAEDILVSAGNEQLYATLLTFLGRDNVFGVEDPGYPLIARLYGQNGARVVPLPLDAAGVTPDALETAGVNILHISPNHHFPTGIVMPVGRRQELLAWLAGAPDRYIIEDDYDSEFRFVGRPIPTLFSVDEAGRVIYLNTFSKTIAPSIRISYMVLPHRLLAAFREKLGFYASTVSGFEQYTLARFMAEGYYEKHLNRMRKRYHQKRDAVIACIRGGPLAERARITEEDAGLHFLMTLDTTLPDGVLRRRAAQRGVRLAMLSEYYNDPDDAPPHVLVVNYSGIDIEKLPRALARLAEIGEEQDHA